MLISIILLPFYQHSDIIFNNAKHRIAILICKFKYMVLVLVKFNTKGTSVMKKIASFVLVLSMLFCNVSTLALASEEKNQDQVYTLNEYEVLEKAYEEHKKNFSDESKNNDGSASFFNTNNITDNNTENNGKATLF